MGEGLVASATVRGIVSVHIVSTRGRYHKLKKKKAKKKKKGEEQFVNTY